MWERDGQSMLQKIVGVTSGGSRTDCLKGDHSYDTDVFEYQNWIDGFAGSRMPSPACGSSPSWQMDQHVRGATVRLTKDQSIIEHLINVPTGLASLRVAMNGEDDGEGRNDFDLYLGSGNQVDLARAACTQNGSGQFAFCDVPRPKSGPWTIVVIRKKGEGLAQLSVTFVPAVRTP